MNSKLLKVSITLGMLILAQGAAQAETALSASMADEGLQWGPCPAFFPAGPAVEQ